MRYATILRASLAPVLMSVLVEVPTRCKLPDLRSWVARRGFPSLLPLPTQKTLRVAQPMRRHYLNMLRSTDLVSSEQCLGPFACELFAWRFRPVADKPVASSFGLELRATGAPWTLHASRLSETHLRWTDATMSGRSLDVSHGQSVFFNTGIQGLALSTYGLLAHSWALALLNCHGGSILRLRESNLHPL